MANKPNRIIQTRTPGAAFDPDLEPATAPENLPPLEQDDDEDQALGEDALPPDLMAMIERRVNEAVAAKIASQRAATVNPAHADAPLLHERDVDPKTITRMVLTQQGYVLPANYGQPASTAAVMR